jgi:hypothetical protein|tara:strand:- start:1 stop:711 length:711 start_codon:yes stop_codon:yes gene_type:complete
MEEQNMKLFYTDNYSVFKMYAQNRNINENNVKKMVGSIEQNGLIQPLIISSDGYVIDGQHRLAACMRLGIEVPYVVNYRLTNQAIIEANNTQKSWNADDRVKHYAEKGNLDYKLLEEKVNEYKDVFTSGKIHTAFASASTTSVSASIKKGVYKIDSENGEEVLENCIIMKNLFADAYHTRFVRAIRTVMLRNENFDIQELVKKFSMKKFNFYYNESDVVAEIIEVYNYKRKEGKIS